MASTRLERCPHCGEYWNANHYATHRRTCLRDHDILAAIRQTADDGTGRAIGRIEYRNLADKPVGDDHIARTFGTWNAAMAHLGLLPPLRRRNDPLNMPLTDEERHVCIRRYEAEYAYYPSK